MGFTQAQKGMAHAWDESLYTRADSMNQKWCILEMSDRETLYDWVWRLQHEGQIVVLYDQMLDSSVHNKGTEKFYEEY